MINHRCLSNLDEFLQLKTAQILTVLLRYVILSQTIMPALNIMHMHASAETAPLQNDRLKPFLTAIAAMVTAQAAHKREIAVQCLEALLTRQEVRQAVWAHKDIITGCAYLSMHISVILTYKQSL